MAEIRKIYRLNVNNEIIQPGDEDNPKHLIKRKVGIDFAKINKEKKEKAKAAAKNQVLEETIVPGFEWTNQSVLNEFRDKPLNEKREKQKLAFKSVLDEDIPWEEYGVESPEPVHHSSNQKLIGSVSYTPQQ